MRFFYKSVLLVAALGISLQVRAAGSVTTLQEVIEKTVTTNPEIQARFHNFNASQEERKAARGGLLPKADVITTYRKQETVFPNNFGTNIPDRQTQLVIKQMLFDGFATTADISRLGHISRVRYYELMSAIQSTALETVVAYNDVLRYRQLVEYAKDNYIVHKQLFDRIEDRVNAGVARRVDLEQASGRLALAEANLLTETTNLHDVSARYQRLTGELPPDNMQDVDFFKAGVASSAVEALQRAYRQNPELLSAIENIVATQEEVRGREGRYLPRLDLQARKNLEVSSDGRNSSAAADVLELTLTFNLFNGLTDKSLVNQTVERLNSAQDLRDKACVDTRQQLVIAYNDIAQLKGQLGYRDQHQLSIEKAREAYRKQFDIGQRTLLDLLDTENEYFQARRTYTITERDLYAAYARTYASEGDLLNKLGVMRKDLPEMTAGNYTEEMSICQAAAPEVMQIDKAAIVAQAKPLSSTLTSLNEKPATPAVPKFSEADLLGNIVVDWAKTWQQKDFDKYVKFYAPDFVPDSLPSHKAWLDQRRKRLSKTGNIGVEVKDVKVNVQETSATATFQQQYTSDGYSDIVTKELQFRKIDNRWQIVKESTK